MGWTFAYSKSYGRKELIESLRSPTRHGPQTRILRACAIGNHHWYLAQTGDEIWIGLDLMAGGGRNSGWGHKSMTETCGPYYFDCPLSYLDAASAPTGHAVEWRQKVREYWSARKARPTPATGLAVSYNNVDYILVRKLDKGLGWEAARVTDGHHFRIKAKQLARATFVAAPTDRNCATTTA